MKTTSELLSALAQARQELDTANAKIADLEAKLGETSSQTEQPDVYSSPSFFRTLVEYSQDHVALIDAQGKVLYSNATDGVLGYSVDQFIGRDANSVLHPHDAIKAREFLATLVTAPNVTRALEVQLLHQQGHYVWVEVNATNLLHDPQVKAILITSRDITAHKQAEESLRASETRYRQVVEAQTDQICRYDFNFKLTFVNQAYSYYHGMSTDDLIGLDFLQYVLPDDRAEFIERLHHLNHANPDMISEHRMYASDGTLRWFQWKDTALLDEQGHVREYQGVGRDITERKAFEVEQQNQFRIIEEMRQISQAALDAAPDHLAILNCDGTIINVNKSWKRFGDNNGAVRPINYLGVNYLVTCRNTTGKEADDAIRAADGIQAVIEGKLDNFAFEYPCDAPTEQLWFRMQVTPFDEPAPRRVVVAHVDITEHVQTERIINAAHESLERHVTERTLELAATTQRLEASLEHEREFQAYLMKLHEIVIELTAIDELDAFYKRVVELGLKEFGFERLALFLYDAERKCAVGTYGTDADSNLVAEHFLRVDSTKPDNILMRTLQNSRRFTFDEDTALCTNLIPVGRGWNAASVLWDGHQGLGWLVADNLIAHKPASTTQLDILALYSLSVGTLLARKQTDVMLAEERNRLRTLIDAVPDLIYVKDIKHRVLLSNTAFSQALGAHPPEAIYGTTDFDFYPPELAAKYYAEEEDLFRTGNPLLDHEELARVNDGELQWVSTNKVPLKNLHGDIVGLAGVARDITERKARERDLRFHAGLQEAVTDAVIATDMDFRIQSWNKAATHIYGWTAEEALGKSIRELLRTTFPVTANTADVRDQVIERGFWVGEIEQYRKDGQHIHIMSSVVLLKDSDGQHIGAVEVNHDITEQKQAEISLQQKAEEERTFQHYLKELHDISMELALIDQLDDFYRFAVEQGLKRLGFERLALFLYEPEHGVARGTFGTSMEGQITDERHFRFVPDPNGVMMRALARSERLYVNENALLYSDLATVGKGWNAAAALWNGTRSVGLLVADNYITRKRSTKQELDVLALYALTIGTLLGRKQTEVALRQSEASLLSVMNSTSIGIILVGSDGVIRLVNHLAQSYSTWLYHQPLEMGKTQVYDLKISDPTTLNETITRVFAGQRITHEVSKLIGVQAYTFDIRFDPVITSAGETVGTSVSIINITAHKQAEEALRQAFEREKELGELKSRFVSMASHEFRTPLATILATTETLMHYRSRITDIQIDQRFDKIRQQVIHMKEIMEDMLQLTHIQAGHMDFNPMPADLDELCSEIIDEHLHAAGNPNRIRYLCTNSPLVTRFDLRLMRQIINNLVTNALKYSPPETVVRVILSKRDNEAIVRVVDDGIGIPAEDLKHLFTPFHRARNVGTISGTGLGLSIIKQAVDLHGGTISVKSEVGTGSTFTVIIPMTAQLTPVANEASVSE